MTRRWSWKAIAGSEPGLAALMTDKAQMLGMIDGDRSGAFE